MIRPNHIGPSKRCILVALLALCLGVRLLTPAGFMPSLSGGALAIVPCPDADGVRAPSVTIRMPAMPMAGMVMSRTDHPKHNGIHQLCPYAAAGSIVGTDPGTATLVWQPLTTAQLPLARLLPAFGRHATRDRPPSQGPPLAA